MTKPDDVPHDVWDVAERCFPDIAYNTVAIRNVARAIMAEREACAQVVDTLAEVISDEIAGEGKQLWRQVGSTRRHAVQTAAAAIRNRGH